MIKQGISHPIIFSKFDFIPYPYSPTYTVVQSVILHPSLHMLYMSLHHQAPILSTLLTCKFLHESCLDSNTSFHNPSFSILSLHLHFANKALLKFVMSLIPNHPSSFGLHKYSHLIQTIFLSSKVQSQRNFLYISVIFLHVLFGALKKKRQNKGKEDMTDLIKQTRPTKDSNFPFHFDSLFTIFPTTSCKKKLFSQIFSYWHTI